MAHLKVESVIMVPTEATLAVDTDLPLRADIMRAVAWLAHRLGMEVTAEGVETEEQAAAARAVGCDRAQGYLFARPLPASEAGELLSHWSAETALQPVAAREPIQSTASYLRSADPSGNSDSQ